MWEPHPTVKAPWEQTDALGFPIETRYRALSVTQFWVDVLKNRVFRSLRGKVYRNPGESQARIKWDGFKGYWSDWTYRGRAFIAQMQPGDQIFAYDYMGFMGALSGAEGYVLVRGQTKVAEITGSVS